MNSLKITNTKYLNVELCPSQPGEDPSEKRKKTPTVRVCVYKIYNTNHHLILKLDGLHFDKIISIFREHIQPQSPSSYYEEFLGKDIKFERIYFDDSDSPCYTLYIDGYSITLSLSSWMKISEQRSSILNKVGYLAGMTKKAHAVGPIIYSFLKENREEIFSRLSRINPNTIVEEKQKSALMNLCLKYGQYFLIEEEEEE